MSRKLRVSVLMFLSLLISAPNLHAADINLDEIAQIKTDETALLEIKERILEEMKSLNQLNGTIEPQGRFNLKLKARISTRVDQFSSQIDKLVVEKRVNPLDLAQEDSVYTLTWKAYSGLVVLSNIKLNAEGLPSAKECSHLQQTLEARNHLKDTPQNVISGTDIWVEHIRLKICMDQK